MIHRTPTRFALSGERGIALSKHFSRSLSAQLMGGVLLSLFAAVLVFALCGFCRKYAFRVDGLWKCV